MKALLVTLSIMCVSLSAQADGLFFNKPNERLVYGTFPLKNFHGPNIEIERSTSCEVATYKQSFSNNFRPQYREGVSINCDQTTLPHTSMEYVTDNLSFSSRAAQIMNEIAPQMQKLGFTFDAAACEVGETKGRGRVNVWKVCRFVKSDPK